MIVADVVYAISRIEIEDTPTIGGEQFGAEASCVVDVHA
jgi:hypothetical protein